MPASAVKPGQEKYWEQAKQRAEEQGHKEDWPYIMAIFQTMTKNKAATLECRLAHLKTRFRAIQASLRRR